MAVDANGDYIEYTPPAWLPDGNAYNDPAADFRRFASDSNYGGPDFFQRRAGLNDFNARMQSRYMLNAPGQAAASGGNPSYYDFLVNQTNMPPVNSYGTPNSYQALRAQAQEAAIAGVTAPGAYLENRDGTAGDFQRRAWLSDQFAGQNAAANQMGVANLLALQRNRGATGAQGAYTGQMGQAITNAMNTMYQSRLNQGAPKESFLDWYLNQPMSK